MKICFDIADAQAARVVDAVAATQGWTEKLGITKEAFAKRFTIETWLAIVRQFEGNQAGEAARAAAEQKAESEIVIT